MTNGDGKKGTGIDADDLAGLLTGPTSLPQAEERREGDVVIPTPSRIELASENISSLMTHIAPQHYIKPEHKRAIILPNKGTAYVVADLHGNLNDFRAARSTFVQALARGEDAYLVLLGDYVDPLKKKSADGKVIKVDGKTVNAYEDRSLELLVELFELRELFGDRVIPLMGDHDAKEIWPQLNINKFGEDLRPITADEQHRYLQDKIRQLPLLVKTESGIILSHTGPASMLKSFKEIENLDLEAHIPPEDKGKRREWKRDDIVGRLLFGRIEEIGGEDYRVFLEKEMQQYLRALKGRKALFGHTGIADFEYEVGGRRNRSAGGVDTIFDRNGFAILRTTEGRGYEEQREDGVTKAARYFAIPLDNEEGLIGHAAFGNNNWDKHFLENWQTKAKKKKTLEQGTETTLTASPSKWDTMKADAKKIFEAGGYTHEVYGRIISHANSMIEAEKARSK